MTKEKLRFDPPITDGVVVGYDGSEMSDVAVKWATEEARARGYTVHVVRAWTLSSAMREMGSTGGIPSFDECDAAMAKGLAEGVAAIDTEGLDVAQHVVHASTVPALLAAAEHANLLVVGQRGRGGFAGLRLGSSATQVVEHSPCTVTVVR